MLTRILHGFLGAAALLGCVLSLRNDWYRGVLSSDGVALFFIKGLGNALHQFVFFTFLSNALVAITSLQLALRKDWMRTWHVVRITGIICITITGVVFNLLLNPGDQRGIEAFTNAIVHIGVPIGAPLLWLLLGPRTTTMRRVLIAAIIPICWLVATMIRGVVTSWYPYTIIDVGIVGWGGACAMVGAILAFYFIVGAVMTYVDALARRRSSAVFSKVPKP